MIKLLFNLFGIAIGIMWIIFTIRLILERWKGVGE